jgi:hypothetical protein
VQATELEALGCSVAQGFLYSPAVAPAEIAALAQKPAGRWATARRGRTAERTFIDEMLVQLGVPEGRS